MNPISRLRRYPLLHALVQTGRREAPPVVALRNTVVMVAPLAIGVLTGHLDAALGVSVGALNAMFADQSGPYRLRLQHMLLTALAAGVAAFAGAFCANWVLAFLSMLMIWSFFAGLLVAVSPQAARVGLISVVVLLVLGDEPQSAAGALQTALLIFSGGALQALFAIAAWPLKRYLPERLAVAQALRALASAARQPLGPDGPVPLPPSLNDLQRMLFGSGHARGRAVEALRVLAELAERMRIELLALAELQSALAPAAAADVLQATRSAAARVLDALAVALEHAAPPQARAVLAGYVAAAAALGHAAGQGTSGSLPMSQVVARTTALGCQLRAADRHVDGAGSHGEIRALRTELSLPLELRPANPVATLRASLRSSASAFRHAVRLAVCVVVAMALSKLLPLAHGYWLPMTVAIVLRVDFGATWKFGLLRTAGTLGGLVFTTATLHFLPDGYWPALALLAILCFAFRELAVIQYGVAVVFLTGLVVVLLSLHGVPADAAVHARAICTVPGSALALTAYLVWPTWERGREGEMLARMLEAYRDYLLAVLHGEARARRETRVAARAARSDAEASLERLRSEPVSRDYAPRAEALIAQANDIVRTTMMLEAGRGEMTASLPDAAVAYARLCSNALTEAARAARGCQPPAESFPLREAQRSLAQSLHANGTTADLALLDASDRIADTIDSLLHVLTEPCAPA